MTYIREHKATPAFVANIINLYKDEIHKVDRKFVSNTKVFHPLPDNTVVTCRVKSINYWLVLDYRLEDDEKKVMEQLKDLPVGKGELLKTAAERSNQKQYGEIYNEIHVYVYQEDNPRLDSYVSAKLSDKSRSYGAKLVELGHVKVNGKVITKPSSKVNEFDVVEVTDIDQTIKDEFDVKILFEDDDTLVLVKPTGMLTHSKGEFYPEQTVATFIAPKVSFEEVTNRSGIVHRLDRGTSGIILCAKNAESQSWYQKQFANRNVKKTYIALVSGVPKNAHAIIDLPIERNPKKPQTFRVGHQGKPALTEYTVLDTKNGKSLIELKPTTGRTHQLRVHLAYINTPIVGDIMYGGSKSPRLMLHAKGLEITMYGSHERKIFEADPPKEFSFE